jgi:hypothetical protein
MSPAQRSVAVFKWNDQLSDFGVEDDPERLALLMAQAPAKAILAALRKRGYHTDTDTPYDGEAGWHFTVDIDGQTFGVFTSWTGIADQDYFAVSGNLKRGIFAALFLKPVQNSRLEPICRALDEAFALLPFAINLQWLTDEQFDNSYCKGQPLP